MANESKSNEAPAVQVAKPKERKNDNVIYIGDKPFMSYVMACVTQLSRDAKEIHVCARGKYISKAVDVAEVTCKRFFGGKIEVGVIKTNSEEFKNKDNRDTRVSIIDLQLKQK